VTDQAIHAPFLFDGTRLLPDRAVILEGDRVAAIIPPSKVPPSLPIARPEGAAYLAPGLIDLQVNGGGGVLFNDALSEEGLARIAGAHRALGTSYLLPTLISGSTEQIEAALDAVRAAVAHNVPGILGLHVEGPFFAPFRRGIHPAGAIRPLSPRDLALLTAPVPFPLTLTLAPETVPEPALRALAAAGVVLLAGHTEATPEQISRARAAGLAGFTHLFNAMPPIAARAPGPAGAALADRDCFASMIVDGLHVHPEPLRLALAAKGPGRLFLVSDAMPTVGSPLTRFRIGETMISLREGRLVDAEGRLGGAHLSLAQAVHNAHHRLGPSPEDSLRMATATPAACLRLTNRLGLVAPGTQANLTLFDASLALLGTLRTGTFFPAPGRHP
jgi:N-acetylglucosamine-6-phosphate deacetylase